MKIDFNASYKSLAKLIFANEASAPAKPAEKNFATDLEAAGRLNPKVLEISPGIAKIEPVKPEAPAPAVQPELPFQDKLPALIPPTPGVREIAVDLEPNPLEPDGGVKTPTVVSARRTTLPMDYQPAASGYSSAAFKPLIESFGIKHGLDPILGMAVARAESSFNPNAISNDGHASKGLFQLLDKTGKDMMTRLARTEDYNPFDPELNTDLGLGYLRYLHDIFSTSTELPDKNTTVAAANSSSLEKLAVAAYNAGEGRVASAQRRAIAAGRDPGQYEQISEYLPEITQKYVERVTSFKTSFASNQSNSADS